MMINNRASRLSGIALLCTGSATGALHAQEIDPFGSIEYRARPEYSTQPINVGPFEISPQIEVQAEAIDRVFASNQFAASDIALTVRPRVFIADRRSDRSIQLNLSTGIETYVDGTAADRVKALAQGRIRLGLNTRTRPFLGFDVNLNETSGLSLGSDTLVAQPIKLFSYGGYAGVEQEFGPVSARFEGNFRKSEYKNDLLFNGVLVDGGFRNFESYGGKARLSYSVNEAQRIYVEGRMLRFNYTNADNPPFPAFIFQDRSADNRGIRIGYERRLTELLQFDINVGYAEQNYDNRRLNDIKAFVAEAGLYYSPTPLTRFRLEAVRSIDDTINPLFSSFFRNQASLSVEHELKRDVVVGAKARYADYSAGSFGNIGDEYEAMAFARIFTSPRLSFKFQASHFERTGLFEGSQTRVQIGATYNF